MNPPDTGCEKFRGNELPIRDYQKVALTCFTSKPALVAELFAEEFGKAAGQMDLPNKHLHHARFHVTRVPLDFGYAYNGNTFAGAHLNPPPRQFLFWEPANSPGTAAMMTNWSSGGIHQVEAFSRREGCCWDATHVLITNEPLPEYPGFRFQHIPAGSRPSGWRELSVILDEPKRWYFGDSGPRLPFENPQYYRRRRIRDRINKDVIMEYMNALGWDISDQQFWRSHSPAWLIWDDSLGKYAGPVCCGDRNTGKYK
ncbi:MAG: hypothetical protein KDA96_09185 [Planctomycetaceae bacterium]|nr:hypothetical protein [Planctomycetaceae bacterium]